MRQLEGAEAQRVKQEKLWKTKEVCTGNGWDQNGKKPCGEAFEIDELDIQKRSHTDYGGGTDTYYGFTCPVCRCFTELNKSSIPSNVRANASSYGESGTYGSDNGDK